MKIAVLADIHGNLHGLEAILADIERQEPDVVVCAGDMTGCHFPGSLAVLQRLRQAGVAMALGNQEEFFSEYLDPQGDEELKTAVRLRPMHFFARQMPHGIMAELKALPLTLTIPGPAGQDVLICHGSPAHTRRSFASGIDSVMANELNQVQAAVIAAGHLHMQWHQTWGDKLLILAGSAGLPLREAPGEVDYLLLTFRNQGWHFEYRSIRYDHQAALQALLNSGFLEEAGPVGWLVLDEVICQRDHLMPFLTQDISYPDALDEAGWENLVFDYLDRLGRGEIFKRFSPAH